MPCSKLNYATQLLALAALLTLLTLGLLPALLSGLLVYFLVEFGARRMSRIGVIPTTAKMILLGVIAVILLSSLFMGVASLISFMSEGQESIVVLLRRTADIVGAAKNYIPLWAQDYIPTSVQDWQLAVSGWLRSNAGHLSILGKDVGLVLARCIFGMIIGGLIAIAPSGKSDRPLASALGRRVHFLATAFRRIVFSQCKISALNTFLTALFLGIVLPLMGCGLPFLKTLVTITFIVGLLPVIGNLISNSIIVLIALSVSPLAAAGALAFLILIHKLEYFVNAHIIGTQIKAQAWEILLAMLVMETAFGMSGLVAAPIYYAYLKDELMAQKLV